MAIKITGTTVIDDNKNLTSINTTATGNTTITGFANVTSTLQSNGQIDGAQTRILSPQGGSYTTQAANPVGAIKIKLPVAKNNSSTMLRFTVKIYQYSTGQSQTFEIGGYNYGGGSWINVFATNLTDTGVNYTVRFGYDATSDCVWIGETSTTWTYPQVYVTDVQTGYSGFSDTGWASGWAISIVTSFDTVETSRTPNLLYGSSNYTAINHDSLTNYDANKHVDHTGVTMTAGAGLTGGGTIAATRTFDVGAANGITVAADSVAVTQGTGVVVNTSGVHVNATYIGTLSANNTTYVNGKTEGNLNVNNAVSLTSNANYMTNRGSIAAASVDTAIENGFYNQLNSSDSQGILTFNPGGSLGPLQMTFTYGGLLQFRNKTDSTTWTAYKTVLTSANYNSYSPTLTGTGASGTWGINITGTAYGKAEAALSVNNATYINGNNVTTVMESLRANRNISGGGTITVDASSNVLWSNRFIVIANGRGTNFTTTGYYDIICPTSGTITGVGGAANVTATAAGIPLPVWSALYYILPIGSTNTSLAANFRIVTYTADVDIPSDWVLICVRNGDNGQIYFPNGVSLTLGTSYNSASVFSSALVPAANAATYLNGKTEGNLNVNSASYANASITNTFTIGTSAYSVTSGNFGIGTSSPAVKLDVRGVIQGQSYTLPSIAGVADWVKLGTFTAAQTGYNIRVRIYGHQGYNASNYQDFYAEIFFKTSNGVSVDGNGFAGNSWYYSHGFNAWDITPKWVGNAAGVSATSYDLYLYLPVYTLNSHYVVEMNLGGVWTSVGTTGQVDPGSGSSTVCVATPGFNIMTGNVGINNTAPTHKLSVNGTGYFGGALSAASTLAAGNTTITGFVNATSTVNASSYYVGTTLIGNATGPYGKAESALNVNNASYLGTIAAASYVQNTDSRTLSGNLNFTGVNTYFQGSTLGTTSGNIGNNITLFNSVGNNGYFRFYTDRNATGSDWTTASAKLQWRIDTTDMGYIEFNPPDASGITSGRGIAFGGNEGTEAMRVTSTGNVGIGNTAPAHKLRVTGTSSLAGAVSDITTLATGNVTVTGFVNSTTSGQFGGNLAVTGMATFSNTERQSNSIAAAWFSGGTGSVAFDTYMIKRVTWNDGAGNFNIRSGNYFNGTSLVYVNDGTSSGAAGLGFTSDAGADGVVFMNAWPVGVGGTAVTGGSSAYLNTSAFYVSSNLYVGTLLVANTTVINATHLGGTAAASYYRSGGTDVALADGGTNATLTAVAGGITYSTASALAISAAGTSGQALISGGTGAPTWTSNLVVDFMTKGSSPLAIGGSGGTPITQLHSTGTTFATAAYSAVNWGLNTAAPGLIFAKTKTGIIGNYTSSQAADNLGEIRWSSSNSSAFIQSSTIRAEAEAIVSGANGSAAIIFETGNTSLGTPAERMRISSNGNIGVGTAAPSYKLDVNGTFNANGNMYYSNRPAAAAAGPQLCVNTATGLVRELTSSRRFKFDIREYDKGLEDVKNLRPVLFKYSNDDENKVDSLGFIAEDLNDQGLTEMVLYDADNLPYSINYSSIPSLLTNAIKEQQVMIDELKDRVKALEDQISRNL